MYLSLRMTEMPMILSRLLSKAVYYPTQSVTEYHRLTCLNRRNTFSIVLEAGSPILGCQQGWFLARCLSLDCRRLSPYHVIMWPFLLGAHEWREGREGGEEKKKTSLMSPPLLIRTRASFIMTSLTLTDYVSCFKASHICGVGASACEFWGNTIQSIKDCVPPKHFEKKNLYSEWMRPET